MGGGRGFVFLFLSQSQTVQVRRFQDLQSSRGRRPREFTAPRPEAAQIYIIPTPPDSDLHFKRTEVDIVRVLFSFAKVAKICKFARRAQTQQHICLAARLSLSHGMLSLSAPRRGRSAAAKLEHKHYRYSKAHTRQTDPTHTHRPTPARPHRKEKNK